MKKSNKQRKETRVRQKIRTSGRGRKLTVFKSNKYIWAQIIDLPSGQTLVSGNTKVIIKENPALAKKTKSEQAYELGKLIAKKAVKKDIKNIVFDRGSYQYHGRVKSLAEGAREGGLKL